MTGEVRSRLSRNAEERLMAGVIVIISVALLVISMQLGVMRGEQPGPGLFPAVVAIALLILAAIWLAQGARMPQDAGTGLAHAMGLDEVEAQAEPADLPEQMDTRSRAARTVFVIAWALVPILLLTRIGFILTITLYVSGMLLVIGRTSRWWTVPIVLVSAVAIGMGARAIGIYLPEPIPLLAGLVG